MIPLGVGVFAKFSLFCLIDTVSEESLSFRLRGVRIASSISPVFPFRSLYV